MIPILKMNKLRKDTENLLPRMSSNEDSKISFFLKMALLLFVQKTILRF